MALAERLRGAVALTLLIIVFAAPGEARLLASGLIARAVRIAPGRARRVGGRVEARVGVASDGARVPRRRRGREGRLLLVGDAVLLAAAVGASVVLEAPLDARDVARAAAPPIGGAEVEAFALGLLG